MAHPAEENHPLLLCTARQSIADRIAALAANGTEQLALVERADLPARVSPGAVILLDLPFGGSAGAGAIATLRCDARCSEVPIVALVDDDDDAAVRDALGAGANDFLRASYLERDLFVRLAAQRRSLATREELRLRESDLRNLVELTRSFAGTLDIGALLHDVTGRLAEALALRRCSLVLTDARGEQGTVIATSDDIHLARRPIDLAKYPEIREALRTRRAVVVEDADRHPLLDPVKDAVSAAGMGAMAVLPLALEAEILGVLFLRAPAAAAGRSFTLRELDFATTVANATAVALRNARSVAEIRSKVEQVEAQALARKQYEEIYEHVADGIALVDVRTGAIHSANPAGLEILGLDAEAVRGRQVRDVLEPAERGVYRELVGRASAGESLRHVELEARRRDGSIVHVEVSASHLDERLVVLSVRDVTERKRLQVERLRIEEELAATRHELEAAARQAMIVELAGAAAHELNQPLTSVMGYAELLHRRLDAADPSSRALGIILREAERMAVVVRKIGNMTRHETKPYVGESRIVDLERAGEASES